jgi:hypothetical protein
MDRDSSKESPKVETNGADAAAAANGESQVTRRRALIVALTAVPVVMSITRTSAWATSPQPNCSIVASYVNGGNHFTSPQLPGHNVTINNGDKERCHL